MNQELYPELPVLVVDDEENFLNSIGAILKTNGIRNVECCKEGPDVMTRLKKKKYSVILLDLQMPRVRGEDLLPAIVELYPEIPVIVLTGLKDNIKSAIGCMKNGAFDYLIKPPETADLVRVIEEALKLKDVHKEIVLLKKGVLSDNPQEYELFPNIISKSGKMKEIFQIIGQVAVSPRPVLIGGECGVGKELIALAVHRLSHCKGEFVAVNTGGVDDFLFSDTLFGHVQGAFTGATKSRQGMIEKADEGTIFLDEIGELSPASQVKLLRLIQEGEYYPLGADTPKKSNARVVAATNKDLLTAICKGDFREDLYYRLETHNIYIPPLRKRKEDIPILVYYFLEKTAAELQKKKPVFPKELIVRLENYSFPGNIRELENMVYDAVARHRKFVLSLDVFEEKIKRNTGRGNSSLCDKKNVLKGREVLFGDTLPTLAELERVYFKEVIKRTDGNISISARIADLERNTFKNRVKKLEEKTEGTDNY